MEDIDGDGDMDIVSGSLFDSTVAWYENDGNADPTWTAADISVGFSELPNSVFVADFDGDGDMDIVSSSPSDDIIAFYENVGKSNVTGASCSISPELPLGLSIAQGTCTISGTPLEEMPSTEFLVRAKKDGFVYSTTINISSSSPDPDGDGYCDINITVEGTCIAVDAFPGDSTEWLDTDGDGIGNNADPDDDGDGLSDIQERNSVPVTDSLNPDTDGDGYCDGPITIVNVCVATDAFPTDPDEWNDNDGDGIGDNEDPDDDNDNILDVDEIANGTDSFDGCDPDPNSTACDIDEDGLSKGIEDGMGTDANNPDTDGDGYCDGPLTVIGVCEGGDDFPLDAAAHKDTDGDGMPDTLTGPSTSDPALVEDLDDDNDGLNDTCLLYTSPSPRDS